ncbi:intracellular ribonuclease LX-like [Malania oleifera]|uniref:intracellular ribonuclease LX-like n=1 Tax=Malania oleifera TaxID=397392 RepID=UPI0025AECBB9|nr:intracellular ribonuclease LX-like [Malania oleifera]
MLFKMHPPVILCTAAFFILSLLCSPASPQQPAGDQSNPKLIKLAIFWPTSLCNGKTKCKYNTPPDRFSIHGPWPLYRDPPGPDTIDWDTFPNDTEEKMKVDWASYGTTTNRQFWNHEWKDHGRISGLLPPKYFDLGLDLFYRADGKSLILLCNKDKEGVVQLYEIDICVDHATAAHDYADCPQPTPGLKSLCPNSFRLTKATVTIQFTGSEASDSPVHDEF